MVGANGLYASVGEKVRVVLGRKFVGEVGTIIGFREVQVPQRPWIHRLYAQLDNGISVLANNCFVISD
jgi:hypothetical protein